MRSYWVCAALILFVACSGSQGDTPIPDPNLPEQGLRPSFHEDVEVILQENCQQCHRPDGIGPFSMLGYEETKAWSSKIAAAAESRTMPPWLAFETNECQPPAAYANDIRLSDADIGTIKDWVAAGSPQGDRSKAPAAKVYPPDNLAGAQTLSVQAPATLVPGGDSFKCFVIDPGLTDVTYVSGVNFLPGNAKIVHHALLFLDAEGASDALVGPDGSYDCFGGPGFSQTQVLFAWAPGAMKADLPSNLAMRLVAGSKLVLQVHYHPTLDSIETDQSAIELRTTSVRPEYIMQILLIGNFDGPLGDHGLKPGPNDRGRVEFRIPAGAKNHVEEMSFVLPRTINGDISVPDLKVISVGTHMHYVGTDMRWDIEHPTPKPGEAARQCMIHTPRWNFEWQRAYAYNMPIEQAPELRPDDVLHLRCIYDNTMDNVFVARALREQGKTAPEDVTLGESTLEEMCLAVATIAYVNPF